MKLKLLKEKKMINKIGSLQRRFVQAGMNLEGTANQRLSKMLDNKAQVVKDASTMNNRIESLIASHQPITIPAPKKADEIIAENSINFLA